MNLFKTFVASTLVGVLLAGSSQAASIAIANADFEANGPGFVDAASWTGGPATARVADHASFRNESALFGGALHFAFTQGTTGAAEQTLTATYGADLDYILGANVNYGSGDIGVDGIFELGYDAGAGFVSLGSTAIDLEALADVTDPTAGTGWDAAAADPVSVASGDAAVGENIIIRINSSVTQGLWFDNVTLQEVPEPTTFALFGLGLLGVAARRRRVA